MFQSIKFKVKRGFSKRNYYCIYDDDKVKEETARQRIRENNPTRNILFVSEGAYKGIVEKMVICANKYLEEEKEKDNENIC